MDKNKLKKIIIIFCILLILILVVMTILNKKNKENENAITETPNLDSKEQTENNSISFIEYEYIKASIQQYINTLNTDSSSYYGRDENNNYVKVVEEDEIKQNILNLLSKKYINENNITSSNVYDIIETTKENKIVLPIEIIKIYEEENISSYKVKIITADINNKSDSNEEYYVISIDSNNSTFNIEPIKTSKDLDNYKITEKPSSIEIKNNNEFMVQEVTGEVVAKEYFNLYKYLLLIKPEIAYNFLDEEYKKARFEDVDEFEQYIQNIKPRIEKMRVTEYEVNLDNNDYEQYICKNQYGDIFIFNEIATLDFGAILDEYTIEIPQFKEKYDSVKTQEKVFLNIEKLKQALNAKDYEYVYDKLNNTFKNKNYSTISSLESYLKSNLPEFIEINYEDFSNEGETYIYNIEITDLMKQSEETKNMQIIMKLKDNYDFEMSFNLK